MATRKSTKAHAKAVTREFLQVRVPLDLIDEIDDVRGLAPREAFIRELIADALKARRTGRLKKR